MIEQVKGFSYSASALLGANSFIPMAAEEDMDGVNGDQKHVANDSSKRSWWRVSLASPKVRDPISGRYFFKIFFYSFLIWC